MTISFALTQRFTVSRARLRITQSNLHESRHCEYVEPGQSGTQLFPVLRLRATLIIGGRFADAIIDTGAWISVMLYSEWKTYEKRGLIAFLQRPNPVNHQSIAVMGGSRSQYQLGRISIGVVDRNLSERPLGQLRTAPVLFQLLDRDAKLPSPIILGLHGGILDGRRLVRESVMPGNSPNFDNNDCGHFYGQDWYLETS